MLKDIDGKTIEVGDTVIVNDGFGVLKADVVAIGEKTIKLHWYCVDNHTIEHTKPYYIKRSSYNAKYMYRICS